MARKVEISEDVVKPSARGQTPRAMIGAQAKAARIQLGLSQDDIAQRTGVGRSTYKHIENDTGDPRRSKIRLVREFYESLGFKFVTDPGVIGVPPTIPASFWSNPPAPAPTDDKDDD